MTDLYDLLVSATKAAPVGMGRTAKVFLIPEEGFFDFVLRITTDRPAQLNRTTSLTPTGVNLWDEVRQGLRNFGQPLMRTGTGISINLRHPGIVYSDYLAKGDALHCLEQLMRRPYEVFLRLVEDVRFLRERGYLFDASPHNLMVTEEQFGVVDVSYKAENARYADAADTPLRIASSFIPFDEAFIQSSDRMLRRIVHYVLQAGVEIGLAESPDTARDLSRMHGLCKVVGESLREEFPKMVEEGTRYPPLRKDIPGQIVTGVDAVSLSASPQELLERLHAIRSVTRTR